MKPLALACALLAPLVTLLQAADKPLTVKQDNYPLRAGCSDTAEQIAALKKGVPVRIRYSLAGSDRPCYAVSVDMSGKKLQGYVWADGLVGLEEFEKAQRSASAAASAAMPIMTRGEVDAARSETAESAKAGKVDYALAAQLNLAADALQNNRPADAEQILAKATAPPGQRDVAMLRAYALLALRQPSQAMDVLDPALQQNPKDARLLALAGQVAYSADDPRRALTYWRDSLDLSPNPALEEKYKQVEKEIGADKSSEKSYGIRFLLRYDTAVAGPDLARAMVAALDEEFSRVQFELGCPADERIVTIVQSRQAYLQSSGAAEWSGGLYDGRIRIPIAPSRQIDPDTRRTFAHEIVHACMSTIGRWPAWLQEGMAQKLSGEQLLPQQREVLKVLNRAGKLPKLEDLGNGWASLNTTQASVAYGMALAAVEIFFDKFSSIGPRNLMNNPALLDQITPQLDQALAESLK